MDCEVTIKREGSRITLRCENSGIALDSVTTILDSTENIYFALTGDQCAITDIRVRRYRA